MGEEWVKKIFHAKIRHLIGYYTCMKILLMCPECDYQEESSSGKELMNKIIMWNHVKVAHPHMAERIMRMYQTVPSNLYGVQQVEASS